MNDVSLEMKEISKSYSEVQVPHNVNLRVREGEIRTLMGENDAGESTLIKIITDIVQVDSGEKTHEGEPLDISHPSQIYHYGIGIVHQEFNLLPDLNVAQNIFIAREPMKEFDFVDEEKSDQDAQKLLGRLQLKTNIHKKVVQLSAAEQQLVEATKALSCDCELLTLDEPTSALADSEAEILFGTLEHPREQEVVTIYISHRTSGIRRIVDGVTALRDGHFIGEHLLGDITEEQLVSEIVGRKLGAYFPKKPKHKKGEQTLEVKGPSVKGLLEDISFEAYEGEILGIVGLMGARGTELAHTIFRKLRLIADEIIVHGKKQEFDSPQKAVRAGIGHTTESRKRDGLTLNQDIKNSILISSYDQLVSFWGLMKEEMANRRTNGYIEEVNIKTTGRDQSIGSPGGGNQQKAVLAKWLSTNVGIFFFDEPTRGIGVGVKMEIYQLIYALVGDGMTVIMISSELPEILGMSDRILVTSHRKLAANLDISEVTQGKTYHYASQEWEGIRMKEKAQQLSATHTGVTRLKSVLGKASILLGLLLLCTFLSFMARNFPTQRNLLDIALQISITTIVAIRQTYTATGGDMDLSVGSVVGLSSIAVSMLLVHDVNILIVILMAIAAGLTHGAISGFIITYGRITPFIVTLSMLGIARGIVYVARDGVPITGLPSEFSVLEVGGAFETISVPIITLSVLAVVMGAISHKFKFGRHAFTLGNNENTAHLSGVSTKKVKFMMYLCCSPMIAIAGTILTSRVISGRSNSGEAYETGVIAATVIGGTNVSGGQGSIIGTLTSALMAGVLNNGLSLLGLFYFYQKIAIGMVIIVAIYIDMLRSRGKQ